MGPRPGAAKPPAERPAARAGEASPYSVVTVSDQRENGRTSAPVNADEDAELDADVPEADALEQRREVSDTELDETPHLGNEVPEADALEQARAVPLDEDEEHDTA